MPKKSNAAERIVHATASLLASRGYFGTGLSDIIARAEAPKGSLYHYFPEGKPQIASAAIGFVADEVASFLDRAGTQAPHARNVLRQFTATLRGWLEHSRFEEACPVLSTSLSIDAELAPVHAECRRALRAWHASIERALRADGLAEKLAASRAWLILAALEGGRSRWPASSGRSRRWMRSRKNCRRYCRPRRVSRPGRPGIRQCCTLSTAIASPETSR